VFRVTVKRYRQFWNRNEYKMQLFWADGLIGSEVSPKALRKIFTEEPTAEKAGGSESPYRRNN